MVIRWDVLVTTVIVIAVMAAAGIFAFCVFMAIRQGIDGTCVTVSQHGNVTRVIQRVC